MQLSFIYSITNIKCIAVLVLYFFWLVICFPYESDANDKIVHKRKSNTGEPIATPDAIQEWEREHQKLYQEEATEYGILEWKTLDNKNLDEYCRKYLHHCVPKRTTHEATGYKKFTVLQYSNKNKNGTTIVEIVTCKICKNKLYYSLTRAPEPNCVYAVNCSGHRPAKSSVILVNKHCDFEQWNYKSHIKNKKKIGSENFIQIHRLTGQPITTDTLLRQYELDHDKLLPLENSHIKWPYVTTHNNIEEYCCKYLQKCVPNRNFNYVSGKWKIETIKYYKENVGKVSAAVVLRCGSSNPQNKRFYYLARALESNCVYAVLRSEGKMRVDPFQIVYKHCDFEHTNVKLETLATSDIPEIRLVKKIKVENSATTGTLQLFPQD